VCEVAEECVVDLLRPIRGKCILTGDGEGREVKAGRRNNGKPSAMKKY
jgi:hypothetical protein